MPTSYQKTPQILSDKSVKRRLGILLTNTGTPIAPTTTAVRQFLKEFLSDNKVIKLPRFIWLPILYGFVLPIRPARTALLYQKIWTAAGSPMRVFMHHLANRLAKRLSQDLVTEVFVEVGMNYGSPSIHQGLENLYHQQIDELIALPLYPQYSFTTTASSIAKIEKAFSVLSNNSSDEQAPRRCISAYYQDPAYIAALAQNIHAQWSQNRSGAHLLISFHGIPKRYVAEGDPYQDQCEKTAHALAKALGLSEQDWTLCYQSRFGYNKWLKPAINDVLTTLSKRNIKAVDVVCPGFAVDCLETLEEISIRAFDQFVNHGGKTLRYLSALNDSEDQLTLLSKIIVDHFKA